MSSNFSYDEDFENYVKRRNLETKEKKKEARKMGITKLINGENQ